MTKESAGRTGNALKRVAGYLKTPGIISLGGGLPSSEYFPFDELSLKVPEVGHFGEQVTHERGTVITAGKHDLRLGQSLFDITAAFNYGQGTGAPQLVRFLVEHTELVHRPPYRDWQCSMTVGSTSAVDMALRMFCNPGDYIITEEYSFSAVVDCATQMGMRCVGTATDSEGMLPASLDDILSTWDEQARGGPKPFLVYTVPTGLNPTGATQSLQRRKDLYAIAQKHDLYILEDEPYYFLQMEPYNPSPPSQATPQSAESPAQSHQAFLASLVPSYLSLDTDGRVMRMDSFSKVIAPGSRAGWITASAQIVERYVKHADLSTQCPSGMSQLILYKLLDEHWGHAGYLSWLMHIRLEYTQRRDVMLAACDRHLPRAIVSWDPPAAGMFHWLTVDASKHPAYATKSIKQLETEIFEASVAKGALVMPGSFFVADRTQELKGLFFRTTYAAAPFDQINEAIRRFGEALRDEFGLSAAA